MQKKTIHLTLPVGSNIQAGIQNIKEFFIADGDNSFIKECLDVRNVRFSELESLHDAYLEEVTKLLRSVEWEIALTIHYNGGYAALFIDNLKKELVVFSGV